MNTLCEKIKVAMKCSTVVHRSCSSVVGEELSSTVFGEKR